MCMCSNVSPRGTMGWIILSVIVLFPGDVLNGRSQNTEKVKHIRETIGSSYCVLLRLSIVSFFSKWELFLKERICSQRERILSF